MTRLTRPETLDDALRSLELHRQLLGGLLPLAGVDAVRDVLPVDKAALAEVLLGGFEACDPAVEDRRLAVLALVEDLVDDLAALHPVGEGSAE